MDSIQHQALRAICPHNMCNVNNPSQTTKRKPISNYIALISLRILLPSVPCFIPLLENFNLLFKLTSLLCNEHPFCSLRPIYGDLLLELCILRY